MPLLNNKKDTVIGKIFSHGDGYYKVVKSEKDWRGCDSYAAYHVAHIDFTPITSKRKYFFDEEHVRKQIVTAEQLDLLVEEFTKKVLKLKSKIK